MNTAIRTDTMGRPRNLDQVKLNPMPQIMLNVPLEKMALFMETPAGLGLDDVQLVSEIPEWHEKIVEERKQAYFSGNASVSTWEDFEKELDNDGIE
jgi:hypothetical protein